MNDLSSTKDNQRKKSHVKVFIFGFINSTELPVVTFES